VCEVFHDSFSSPCPNIYVFLKAIIATQTCTYISTNSTKQDKHILNRAYLTKKPNNSIIEKYKTGEINKKIIF